MKPGSELIDKLINTQATSRANPVVLMDCCVNPFKLKNTTQKKESISESADDSQGDSTEPGFGEEGRGRIAMVGNLPFHQLASQAVKSRQP
jgi:hypothetical protein